MTAQVLLNAAISIGAPLAFIFFIYTLNIYGDGKFVSTVLTNLIWGATGAFVIAYVTNVHVALPLVGSVEVVRSITAPITEEIGKALFMVYLIWSPRFHNIVEGAIYGFAAGIGFAIAENLYFTFTGVADFSDILTRAISTTLMHASASALVGVFLGRYRRSEERYRIIYPWLGFLSAIVLHAAYNNSVAVLGEGAHLLMAAVAVGALGGLLTWWQIKRGLRDERKRIDAMLNMRSVTAKERLALQQMGTDAIDRVFEDLTERFGKRIAEQMRRLMVVQANIGILKSNLNTPASPHLLAAWREEIDQLTAEMSSLQRRIGTLAMVFFRGVFLDERKALYENVKRSLAESEQTEVHQFDALMLAAERAQTFQPAELERLANKLRRAPIFKDVSLADLENLSRSVRELSFENGQILFDQGESGDTLYMIESGAIALYKVSRDGTERLLRECRAGDVVGELALIDGSPRSARARAKGNLLVIEVQRTHFNMFLKSRPQVVLAMLRFLAERVRETTSALETSMHWARQVAAGNFAEARALSMLAPSEVSEAASEAIQGHRAVSMDTAVQLPTALGGAFSRAAAALERRAKAAEAGKSEPKTGIWSRFDRDTAETERKT
ncbi:MAG: PrsW family glutamic-type intramembrane protease [Anaerolineae bacterium]|nr:PrsW family glutamic-type intramembrane protease [Anaerolineae bacterium]MDW8300251.1 PrsW family glutamic-type intramembrane protease [Anaerolineae bacterium]